MTRLDCNIFDIPVTEIRAGYRSAVYFNRAKTIAAAEHPDQIVTMQVFQRNEDAVVCGVDEAIALLRLCSGEWTHSSDGKYPHEALFRHYLACKQELRQERPVRYNGGARLVMNNDYSNAVRRILAIEQTLNDLWVSGWDRLEVKALHDGDIVQPWEPVLTITGPYHLFAHLESVYLGILARQTRIATNTKAVVAAANGKPVLFFADRFDHYATQGGDGYAAHVGGAAAHATQAMGAWWGQDAVGTMPHALIATFDGDIADATEAFHRHFPDVETAALVDFNNDCVAGSLAALERLGDDLKAVRLDTSGNMVDESLVGREAEFVGQFTPQSVHGVNPALVQNVRDALDANGGEHVKIIVSGGFTAEKIAAFEAKGVPVDSYAVGSSLLRGCCDYTADIVVPVAKKGRSLQDGSRLSAVE